MLLVAPSLARATRRWSRKSNSSSTLPLAYGIGDVPSPRAVTYSATCHQRFCIGARARRVLPAICSQRCSVVWVSAQSFNGSWGHIARLHALLEKVPLHGVARQGERGGEVRAGRAALPAPQLQLAERRVVERIAGEAVTVGDRRDRREPALGARSEEH